MSDLSFNALLTQTCTITRRSLDTTTTDAFGGSIESFTSIATAEDCLFQRMEEDVQLTLRGKKYISRDVVFFKPTADISEDDVLIFSGQKYAVVRLDDAGGQGHHYEAYVVLLEN